MLQRLPSAFRRAVQHVGFSSSFIPKKSLRLWVTYGVLHDCSLNTTSKLLKTRGSIQPFRPVSSSAFQHDPRVVVGGARTRLTYDCHCSERLPFPPGSRGFLYYHSRPGQHACAGEIRFRVLDPGPVCESAADLFASGKDLLDHNGWTPWRVHLLQVYSARRYGPIRQLLQSQGLIDEAQQREVMKQLSMVSLGRLPIQTLRLAFIHGECITPSTPVTNEAYWRQRYETDDAESSDGRWRMYKAVPLSGSS
ncbi:hypothetical protein DFP72DRAFT_916058 [Ephemerocybe angulata]|uniref:Uncharacterized protein n=1 Tax=Ephemerocybe angulata TaxID=980116 RepID=A0A8H6HK26_9AGAR|nr:hypothetical protein DFP72DRAFT_916058 [Tulosesus angulatus]